MSFQQLIEDRVMENLWLKIHHTDDPMASKLNEIHDTGLILQLSHGAYQELILLHFFAILTYATEKEDRSLFS